MRRARVFISCGQKTEKEVSIGLAVRDYFKKVRGFETYFAQRVHDPEGLTENIFRHLKSSEYYVFIDFCRESVEAHSRRGSLFVNQELAIATFLQLPGIGFYEKGRKREGIENYHLYNAYEFEDGTQILRVLEANTGHWDISNVNELAISYSADTTSENIEVSNMADKPRADWYHLDIINRHMTKHALGCLAYVTAIVDLERNTNFPTPTNELVWSGLNDFAANIMAGGRREVDAFFIIYGKPYIHFHHRPLTTGNPRYWLPNLPPGRFLVTYTILATGFESAQKTFFLSNDGTPKGIRFEENQREVTG